MYVSKIRIREFKVFRRFELQLGDGLNILAGDNDVGKSTLLEAIHLVLTALCRGRSIAAEISEELFNRECVQEFFKEVGEGGLPEPPRIVIEAVFDGPGTTAEYQGDFNLLHANESGLGLAIELNADEYAEDFWSYVRSSEADELPVEYFKVTRYRFDRSTVFQRKIPLRSSFIDSSGQQMRQGSRAYISRSAREVLPDEQLIALAQSHRKARRTFNADENVVEANRLMGEKVKSLTQKSVSFAASKGTKDAWENSIEAHLDDIPLCNAGAGSQNIIAIELALRKVDSEKSNVILLEEPEGHLSHARLNMLLADIEDKTGNNQILVSTHSSYVANKLMLNRLIWINEGETSELKSLSDDTSRFFSKIAGYDTLRLLFSRGAILVEGDSDELVVQKAYMDKHDGRLPIQDGIEVVSVGTSFLRFFELAETMGKPVVAVTDNDGDLESVERKYEGYRALGDKSIAPESAVAYPSDIAVSFPRHILPKGDIDNYSYNTLEPELFDANNLEGVNQILGKSFKDRDEALRHMKNNKVECAMRFFEYRGQFVIPPYIEEALDFIEKVCGDTGQ